MTQVAREIANLEGPAAMPRKNGELVFEAPWEGRAFGMAVVMHEKGAFPWEEFRDRLVERIGAGSQEYYDSWLGAFESLLLERGLVRLDELRSRAADFKQLERDPIF